MLAHRLALAMGILDVDRMLENMPLALFNRWASYNSTEPINPFPALENRFDRLETMIAQLTAVLFNL